MKRICFLLLIIVLGVGVISAQEAITSQEEEIVFITPEEQPEFPGGHQAGKAVRVYYTVPVMFRLQ